MSGGRDNKKRGAILSAVVIISLLAVVVGLILFPLISEMGGLFFAVMILLVYAGGIVAVILGILAALRQRLREIESRYDPTTVWYRRDILGERAVAEGLIRINPAVGCKLPPKKAKEMQVHGFQPSHTAQHISQRLCSSDMQAAQAGNTVSGACFPVSEMQLSARFSPGSYSQSVRERSQDDSR